MRWAWLALTVLGLPAWGAEARPLTVDEALKGALDNNPQLRRARLDRDSAELGVMSAQGMFDPQLGIDGRWRRSRSKGFFQGFPFDSESRSWDLGTNVRGSLGTGTSYSLDASIDRNFSSFVTNFGGSQASEQIQDAYTSNLSVTLTQELLRGFRMSFNIQNITRARQGLTTAELALEKARQDALAQTASAYWSWAYQDRLRQIAEESVKTAEEALRVGQLKVEAGEQAPVEKTRLEAALVQAQSEALDARNAAQRAADDLLLLIGGSPGEAVMPASQPGDVSPLELDADAAIQVALAQNLDLAIARADLENAELASLNAKHAQLPSLSASGSTGLGAQDTSAGAAIAGLTDDDAFPFVQVSGSFAMPLGNRAARGEARSAAVTETQRRNSVVELEASVRSQVRQQVRVLESSRRRVELADANLRLAEETLAAEEALQDAGRSIQKDVLEARTQVDRTKAEAVKARTDFRLAQVELLRLQGQLGDSD